MRAIGSRPRCPFLAEPPVGRARMEPASFTGISCLVTSGRRQIDVIVFFLSIRVVFSLVDIHTGYSSWELSQNSYICYERLESRLRRYHNSTYACNHIQEHKTYVNTLTLTNTSMHRYIHSYIHTYAVRSTSKTNTYPYANIDTQTN